MVLTQLQATGALYWLMPSQGNAQQCYTRNVIVHSYYHQRWFSGEGGNGDFSLKMGNTGMNAVVCRAQAAKGEAK